MPYRRSIIDQSGMSAMVTGDERLKRPFLLAIADPAKIAGARVDLARKLASFLRSPETQVWISEFGKGKYDDRSLFFPVVILH